MTNPTFKPWPTEASDPIMAELFRRANEKKVTRKVLSEKSGVYTQLLDKWIKGRSGTTRMVSLCFEALEKMQ